MVNNHITIDHIDTFANFFKKLDIDGKYPKKLSKTVIYNVINSISNNETPVIPDKKKKTTGNITYYNMFVKMNNPKVRSDNPDKTPKEHMTINGSMWKLFKEENENYKEILDDFMNNLPKKDDIPKTSTTKSKKDDIPKKSTKKSKKKNDTDDDEE